jgi:glycerate kinase
MRIVIAPDSFKGSLTSKEVCQTISSAFRDEIPGVAIEAIPMADGGEGTIDSLVFSTNGATKEINVSGPALTRCSSRYGVLGDGKTAVIEVASICGITMLTNVQKNPLYTSSYGVGEALRHALDQGFRHFIVGLGGSASNDGGMGMLQALGVEFTDGKGDAVRPVGGSLPDVQFVDFSRLDPRVLESELLIASDVENPLCGVHGASHVFGPQKGASPIQVKLLDEALSMYGDLIERNLKKSLKEVPGAGAAGGIGFALLAVGGAMMAGAKLIGDAAQLRNKISGADWVITGEGQSDVQTLFGKAPIHVAKLAKECGVNAILISGGLGEGFQKLYEYFVSCHSITQGPISLEQCMQNARQLLYDSARNVARLLICNKLRNA